MRTKNIVIDGKYKGCNIKADPETEKITLIKKDNIIDLTNKIKSATIMGGKKNIYEIELKGEETKLKCDLEFSTYLGILLYGIGIVPECMGLN